MQKSFPIRLGIIGAGNMTKKNHLPALVKLRDEGKCTLEGICDINIDAANYAADKYNIPFITHIASEIIERDNIDAICIFGPAKVHYAYGLKTLGAGKHLFVEKPPAENVSQVKEMWDLAQKKELIAAAGFNRRFQGSIVEMKRLVSGESINTAEAVFHKPHAGIEVSFGMKTWLGVSAIHALDLLCYVLGDRPDALWCMKNGGSTELSENFSAVIKWGNKHAIFSSNNSAGTRLEEYSFHSYGTSYEILGNTLNIFRDQGKDEQFKSKDETIGLYGEFESFLDAVVSGNPPIHSLGKIIPSLYLVELIENGHKGDIDWSFLKDKEVKLSPSSETQTQMRKVLNEKNPVVLVLNPEVLKNELPSLSERFEILYEENLANISDENKKRVFSVITGGSGAVPVKTVHLDQLPSVSVVCVLGASVKNWGGEIALDRGISVINTADVYADAVAEFIVMQAMVGLRRASMSHDAMRRGGWGFSIPNRINRLNKLANIFISFPILRNLKPYLRFLRPIISKNATSKKALSRTLHGKTVGIVGFGEITKKTILLFKSLGCDVLVHSEYLSDETAHSLGVRSASLGEVLISDVVTLQRGLSTRTEKLFGPQEINSLRPGCVFINSARAGLVDNNALLIRLKRRDIFACLDVFDDEPLPPRSDIRKLPNVFLTSHIAGSVYHTEGLLDNARKKLIEKMIAYLVGEKVSTVQGREHFENMT